MRTNQRPACEREKSIPESCGGGRPPGSQPSISGCTAPTRSEHAHQLNVPPMYKTAFQEAVQVGAHLVACHPHPGAQLPRVMNMRTSPTSCLCKRQHSGEPRRLTHLVASHPHPGAQLPLVVNMRTSPTSRLCKRQHSSEPRRLTHLVASHPHPGAQLPVAPDAAPAAGRKGAGGIRQAQVESFRPHFGDVTGMSCGCCVPPSLYTDSPYAWPCVDR